MPSIAITLPTGGAYVAGDTARVSLDGVVIDPSVDLAPGGVAFDTDIVIGSAAQPHGLHTVDVVTLDALGNETTTATASVFVNAGPSKVRGLVIDNNAPGPGLTFTITPPLEWE